MHIVRYTAALKSSWDQHVAAARNGHFMHQRDYMEYHSNRFVDHSLIVHDEDSTLLALLPASNLDDVLYSHQGLTFGGFIVGNDIRAATMLAIMEALVSYAKNTGMKQIVYKAVPAIYHQVPSAEDEYALFRVGAQLARVDISTSIDLSSPLSFSSLRVRGAKKAIKAGITVRVTQDYEGFHRIVEAILQEKYDTNVTHSAAEMELLAGRFPNAIHLHAAYQGDTMLAGVLVFETTTTAHAQYIGASSEGRELGALDLIFSTLIKETYAHKRYFDFGISTEDGGRHLNTGLIAQKEGFGGRGMVHRFYRIDIQ